MFVTNNKNEPASSNRGIPGIANFKMMGLSTVRRCANHKLSADLFLSALRVCLTHKLHDSLQYLYKLRIESAMYTCGRTVDTIWQKVIAIAERIVLYVKNAQSDDEHNVILQNSWLVLVAIDRAETALNFQLRAVKFCMNRQKQSKYENVAYVLEKSSAYIANVLSSDISRNPLLAQLWAAAAERCNTVTVDVESSNPSSAQDMSKLFSTSSRLFTVISSLSKRCDDSTDPDIAAQLKEFCLCASIVRARVACTTRSTSGTSSIEYPVVTLIESIAEWLNLTKDIEIESAKLVATDASEPALAGYNDAVAIASDLCAQCIQRIKQLFAAEMRVIHSAVADSTQEIEDCSGGVSTSGAKQITANIRLFVEIVSKARIECMEARSNGARVNSTGDCTEAAALWEHAQQALMQSHAEQLEAARCCLSGMNREQVTDIAGVEQHQELAKLLKTSSTQLFSAAEHIVHLHSRGKWYRIQAAEFAQSSA